MILQQKKSKAEKQRQQILVTLSTEEFKALEVLRLDCPYLLRVTPAKFCAEIIKDFIKQNKKEEGVK